MKIRGLRERLRTLRKKLAEDPEPNMSARRIAKLKEMEHRFRAELPGRVRKVIESIRAGKPNMEELDRAGIRDAVFTELEREGGSKELIAELNRQLDEWRRKRGE